MARMVSCPSCHYTFRAPGGGRGGTVTCPNPSCGTQFNIEPARPTAGAGAESRPGSSPSRPVLLDKLPLSPVASPAFVAIGGVGVLLYGLMLAGVLASMPKRERRPVLIRPQFQAIAPPASNLQVASTAVGPRPAAPERAGAQPPKPDTPKPASETKPPAESEKKPSKPEPKPKPEPNPKKADKAADTKTELAKATPPPVPVRTAVFKPVRSVEDLGEFLDPVGDCELRRGDAGLTISLPGKLHVLSPDLAVMNAPRMLTNIEGDFLAEVYITGEMRPGMQAVKGLPIAYHGAGLLVWNDEHNYVRLERSVAVQNARQLANQVFLEAIKDNKLVGQRNIEVGKTPVHLRIERRGDTLICSYSKDGKAWTEARSFKDFFPPVVQVGISASNTAKKPLQAQFEDFHLTQAQTSGPS